MIKENLAVLAAGYGKRAEVFTHGDHKSLIDLPDGTTIMGRLFEQAKSHDIEQVFVVLDRSVHASMPHVVTEMGSKLDLDVRIIDQNMKQYYGTMYALQLVCLNTPTEKNVVVFEGDVVVSNRASDQIFSATPNTFFVDDMEKTDLESMKALVDGSLIRYFSKQITSNPEFCGIMTLDAAMRRLFVLRSERIHIAEPYYEYVFNEMALEGISLRCNVLPESEWNEIDDEQDYKITVKKFQKWEK